MGVWDEVLSIKESSLNKSRNVLMVAKTAKDLQQCLRNLDIKDEDDFGWGFHSIMININEDEEPVKLRVNVYSIVDNEESLEFYHNLIKGYKLTEIKNLLFIPILPINPDFGFLSKWLNFFKNQYDIDSIFEQNEPIKELFKSQKIKILKQIDKDSQNIILNNHECENLLGFKVLLYIPYIIENEQIQQLLRSLILSHGGAIIGNDEFFQKILLNCWEFINIEDIISSIEIINFNKVCIPMGFDSIGKIQIMIDEEEVINFDDFLNLWGKSIDNEINYNELVKQYPILETNEENTIDEEPTKRNISSISLSEFLEKNLNKSSKIDKKILGINNESKKVRDFFQNLKLKNKEI